MSRLLDRRLTALERQTAPDAGPRPWVHLEWRRGEPEPVPPAGSNALIRRIVSPGDPADWCWPCLTVIL